MKKKLMTVISLIVIVASGIVGYKFFVESKGDIFHVNTVTMTDDEDTTSQTEKK